jgi:hypothetical protein
MTNEAALSRQEAHQILEMLEHYPWWTSDLEPDNPIEWDYNKLPDKAAYLKAKVLKDVADGTIKGRKGLILKWRLELGASDALPYTLRSRDDMVPPPDNYHVLTDVESGFAGGYSAYLLRLDDGVVFDLKDQRDHHRLDPALKRSFVFRVTDMAYKSWEK